ncbi:MULTISPECIES: preprotein translocase subunit YajC [Nocardioides]|uniref:preprotein translocase subunit YajC n=1 Tax=Nocardioides TaxID=1839 RepID=UPI002867D8B6|nr:preprotein translocase subunit YajC [Nocardioides sp. CGMCC 1.13656]
MEFLPLIGIVLLFWLFIIRPQSRRQKELRTMQSSLSVGDEVMLTSGIFGSVQEVADDYVVVEISEGVAIKVAQGAVGSKIRHDEEQGPDETDGEPDEHDEPGTVTDGPEER